MEGPPCGLGLKMLCWGTKTSGRVSAGGTLGLAAWFRGTRRMGWEDILLGSAQEGICAREVFLTWQVLGRWPRVGFSAPSLLPAAGPLVLCSSSVATRHPARSLHTFASYLPQPPCEVVSPFYRQGDQDMERQGLFPKVALVAKPGLEPGAVCRQPVLLPTTLLFL